MHPRRAPFLAACASLAVLILGIATPLGAQQTPQVGASWPVGSAPARFTVEIDDNSTPTPLAWTDLNLPDPRWADHAHPRLHRQRRGRRVAYPLVRTGRTHHPGLRLVLPRAALRRLFRLGLAPAASARPSTRVSCSRHAQATGTTIESLPDMLAAWNKATVIEGRAIVPGIFEGGNRFGPEANLLLHLTGWFNATAGEHLQLAAMSTDASFVLVDGKEVVEWPGSHDFGGGLQGQHMGSVDLTAGPHQLDYYNAYSYAPGGPPLLACLAAKGGPLDKWAMLMPGNTFFIPTAHAHVIDYATQGTTAPPLAIDWKASTQSVVGPEDPNVGFITLALDLPSAAGRDGDLDLR